MADQDRILVVCATRDRNMACARMVESVARTSGQADVALYIDRDQAEMYDNLAKYDCEVRVHRTISEQLGPVASLNELVRLHPGYLAYGAATDDCEFDTPGWDKWVIEAAKSFKASIGVMCPQSNGLENRMDFPWATAKWIEVVGHLAWPGCLHFYWDIMIELLGEATQIAYAPKDRFHIMHDAMPTDQAPLKIITDARNLLPCIALERPGIIKKLREAIARG